MSCRQRHQLVDLELLIERFVLKLKDAVFHFRHLFATLLHVFCQIVCLLAHKALNALLCRRDVCAQIFKTRFVVIEFANLAVHVED